MDQTQITRLTLGLSCPFNLAAATVFAVPSSTIGRLVGLPPDVPVVYAVLVSFLVGLLGLAYGWLALQPHLDRPMVALGAIGKFGVFFIALALWLLDHVTGRLLVVASGDLVFASLWCRWLLQTPTQSAPS